MATSGASAVTVCSKCGEPLNAKGECVACLLRTGLEQSSTFDTKSSASLVFGDFEVVRHEDGSLWELGRGAFAVTYLAVDKVLRRRVALKVIDVPAAARGSHTMRERFLREARAAAALRHPNVAAIYQFGASPNGSRCFYAMELVQGETLETRVRRDGPLNPKLALEIAIEIARALMAAAAQGLIHRDLKPANIMLTSGNAEAAELEVKVIDFGLAKAIADAGGEMDLTHGEFVGTPNFASPEQFGSGPIDARSDIYSLGATLWFALTGLAPHPGSTIEEIRDRQTRDDLPVEQLAARKVPAPVIKLLRRLLAVDPAQRPASARELMEKLDFCRQQLSPGSGSGSFFSQLRERHVVRVAIAYGVTAWLLAQIATQIFPFFEIPNWSVRLVILALVLGFPIALALAWAFDITPEGIVRTKEGVPNESSRRRTHYPFTVGITIVTLAAIGLFAFRLSRQKPSSAPTSESAAAVSSAKSIAVLPFENLSGNPENAYFTDGIQEEILMRLAKIADLKVVSRTSTVRYKRSPGSLREVARQLGVENVLEGSVQRTADRVHINVQLIKAASDAHVWAEAYDRKLTDIFAVESEIAKTIAETLQAKLTGSEQRAIATRPTENTEAHQLYLKGRFFWNKRTSDGMMKSIDYFTRAIEKDPAYGLAYAGLADAYTILPNYSQTPLNESYSRAKAAVLKALELDDNVAEAHIALANLKLWYDWAQGAEEEFKRGIELSPSYATGHQWYSVYLSAMGRHHEAIAEMTKAQELDPFSLIINTQLGLPYLYAREYDRAITHFQKAIEMDPNFAFAHFALAEAYDRKGRYEDAFAEHDKAIALAGEPSQAWLAMTGLLKDTYQTLGGKDYWQKRLEVTRKLYEEHAVTPKAVAEIYAVVGDKEQALGWLGKSYQEHDRFLVFLKVQSEFDTLRGDPRFEALIAKVFSAQKSPTQSP